MNDPTPLHSDTPPHRQSGHAAPPPAGDVWRHKNYVDDRPDDSEAARQGDPDLLAALAAEETERADAVEKAATDEAARAVAGLAGASASAGGRRRWFAAFRIHPVAITAWVVALGISYWAAANTFSYFDPVALCSVDLTSDLVRGNRDTMKDAIGLLKRESPAAYGTLCTYVDRIVERPCVASDWNIDPSHLGAGEGGCFVRGSKTLYLLPTRDASAETVRARADVLARYAERSRVFWTSRGNGGYATPPQPSE